MFNLTFEFKDRDELDLPRINQTLTGLPLSELSMGECRGYMAVTTRMKGTSRQARSYRYGFDRLVLECEQDPDAPLYRFRVDTYVDEHKRLSSDDFLKCWNAKHPGRAMHMMICYAFDSEYAFVVFHHIRDTAEGGD